MAKTAKKSAPAEIENASAEKPQVDHVAAAVTSGPQEIAALRQYVASINGEYAVVLRGSQVLVMRHWIGEDKISRLTFLSTKDFHVLMANQRIWNPAEEKSIPLSHLWLCHKDRKYYEDVYFRPCDTEYELRYNLWRGYAFEPNPAGQHDLFLKHIEENICSGNESHYCWVIDWLAHLIQRPYDKAGTALVLRGEMGTGKGKFARGIGKLFGQHFIPILSRSQLTGRFNSHLADKVIVFVDESGWSHDRTDTGIIQAMITEPSLTIEMKGKDAIEMENYSHFIMAANKAWVVPASGHDERRFAVFDVSSLHRGDKAYFGAIEEQLTNMRIVDNVPQIINKSLPVNCGYASLLHFLLNHKYDEASARTIPQTDALMEQKIRSMSDEFTWWHECLVYGEIGDFELRDDLENYLPCKKFFDHYVKWCEKLRRQPLTDNILPKNLKKMVDLERTRKITLDTQQREYHYVIPSLTRLRAQFDMCMGQSSDWGAQD